MANLIFDAQNLAPIGISPALFRQYQVKSARLANTH
jgi:hypothetical protein